MSRDRDERHPGDYLTRAAGIVDALYMALDPTQPGGPVEIPSSSIHGALWAALIDIEAALRLVEDEETCPCGHRPAGEEGRS